MTHPALQEIDQEPEAVPARFIVLLVFGTAVVTLAGILVAWVLLRAWERGPDTLPADRPSGISHELASTERRGQKLALLADATLASYGRVDSRGIVRIPIDRAIALVASRTNLLREGGP